MDRGTKIYSLILGSISLILAITFLYESPKAKALNTQLQAIKEVREFPYHFKVLHVKDGIATLSSPISTELSCGNVVGIIFPAVKNKSLLSAEYQSARELMAKIQMLASNQVKADPEVNKIVWQLDRNWLIQNGVSFNNY